MAKKDNDPKVIEKALEAFLKNPSPEAAAALKGKDYFQQLEKRLSKQGDKHLDGAIILLKEDPTDKSSEALRKISSDFERPIKSRLECLSALKSRKVAHDDAIEKNLKEIEKIAAKDDGNAAAKLYPALDKNLKETFAKAIVEHRAVKALEAASKAEPEGPGLKILKRAAHLLRSIGEKPAEIAERGEAIFKPPEKQEEMALVSRIDGMGRRLAYIVSPAMGAILIFQALIDEADGMLDFSAHETNRKWLHTFMKKADEEGFIKVDPVYSSCLMDKAAAMAREKGAIVPPEYLSHRATLPAIPSGYDLFDPLQKIAEPPKASLARDAYEKLVASGMYPWMPDMEMMKITQVKLDEIAKSTLVINEDQRMDQMAKTIADAMEDYLEGAAEKLMARLVEEARLFVVQGKAEQARTALAVVEELDEYVRLRKKGDIEPPPPKFVADMFKKVFPDPKPVKDAGGKKKSGIIIP